jgi:16S rRNA (cytosine1402-N4)-methyltransferase|tara:strand:- start:13016 stop:13738 length:723 start_codon:yes stop_codon:yes gene_type:complete
LIASKEIKYGNFNFIHDNFRNLDRYFDNSSISGAIIDCGLSSPQLDSPDRGFSFQKKGPLDMRFNNQSGMTCSDIVNKYKEEEISHILWAYGEEEESRRIAKAIVERRSDKPFTNTLDLSDLIKRNKKIRTKKHAATKSFQALRIAVNNEVLNLEKCLEELKKKIIKGGKIVVISFHSLEDRLVKNAFKEKINIHEKRIPIIEEEKNLTYRTHKLIYPTKDEVKINVRSRSAKMRVIEKL